MTFGHQLPRSPSLALILDSDAEMQRALAQVAELEGLTPIVASSELGAYSLLAEHCDAIGLVLLNLTANGIDAMAFRQWQLDAPRAATIPTVVLIPRELTDAEIGPLRPGPLVRLVRRDALYQLISPYRETQVARESATTPTRSRRHGVRDRPTQDRTPVTSPSALAVRLSQAATLP